MLAQALCVYGYVGHFSVSWMVGELGAIVLDTFRSNFTGGDDVARPRVTCLHLLRFAAPGARHLVCVLLPDDGEEGSP